MSFRIIIFVLMPAIVFATSCSDHNPKRQANNLPAKVLKIKNEVPACCAKKPSRFSPPTKKSLK